MTLVEQADDAAARAACMEIRRVVFIEEQSVPVADELDGLDDTAEHFLARVDGAAVGAARLRLVEGGRVAKGERLAVLGAFRGRQVGVALMAALETRAIARGAQELVGAAQVSALGFYAALGYRAEGEPFLDAGIVHRQVRKTLSSGA